MNKAELIEALAARLGDRKTATAALDAVLAEVQQAVTKGDRVAITGFGVFVYFAPWSALAGLLTWSVAVAAFRYVSLGSILAALVMPLAMVLEITWGGRRDLIPVLYVAVLVCSSSRPFAV